MAGIFPILLLISVSVPFAVGHKKEATRKFNETWPIENDLKCIHCDAKKLGTDGKAKKNEANFKKERTTCKFEHGTIPVVRIFKWAGNKEQIAAAFVQRQTPNIPYVKETKNKQIRGCKRPLYDIDGDVPTWMTSKNHTEVIRRMKKLCFYEKYSVGLDKPIKLIYKLTHGNSKAKTSKKSIRSIGEKLGGLAFNLIRLVIPNEKNYIRARHESEVDPNCTKCTAALASMRPPEFRSGFSIRDILKPK